nr:ST.27 [Starmerella bombicola]
MSNVILGQDGVETVEHLEQQQILDRASIEPESLDETSYLLGYSKRPYPKRVLLLSSIIVGFALCSVSTASAEIDVVYRLICYFDGIDNDKCMSSGLVNDKVAGFIAVSTAFGGAMSLLVSTYLSIMSDRLGRKPVFIGAMLLSCLSQISIWYLVFHQDTIQTYWVLLIPLFVDKLGGGLPLVVQLSVAYVSDMVPDVGHRTRLVAISEGTLYGTLAVGPSLGSTIIKKAGLERLYIISSIGMLIAALVSFFFLKESLSSFHKRRNSVHKPSVKSSFSLLKFDHVEGSLDRWNARLILISSIITNSFGMNFIGVILLFPRRKFGWSAVETGYLISSMSSTRTFWFLLGFPFLYSRLSKLWAIHSDRLDRVDLAFLRVSLLFSATGYLLMGHAQSEKQYFAFGVIDACSAIGRSVFTSSLIKYLPQGQYGSYMAAVNFINSSISVVGPTFFLTLYTWASQWRPFLPFEVQSATFATVLLTTLLLKPAL